MDKLRVLIIMGLLAVAMTVGAKSFQVGDITYEVTSASTCKVKKYNNKSLATDVVIPNTVTYNGRDYTINEVADKAMSKAGNIRSLTISENMAKLGRYAFSECKNLTSLTFNAINCEFLLGMKSSTQTIRFGLIGMAVAAASDESTQFERTPIENLTIGSKVKVIPEHFMEGCGITVVKIPSSVKVIKKGAFTDCSKLTRVDGLNGNIVFEDKVFDSTPYRDTFLAMQRTGFSSNGNSVASVQQNDEPPLAVQESRHNNISNDLPAKQQQPATTAIVNPDAVDIDIPSGTSSLENTFAVIIGNENYHKVDHVPFAVNDAQIFAKYCEKTLGLPAENIYCYTDATLGTMMEAVKRVVKIAKVYNGDIDIIFYYSGHGIPNETSKQAFLLPIDANGEFTESCYSLASIYKELGETGARKVSVFLDACFSGAKRDNGMIVQSRGAAIKPKQEIAYGNMVIFSAASDVQTAYPYKQKKHGLFTYYLLKKLQETKGNVTYGELDRFLLDQVSRRSVVANGREQNPTVAASESFDNIWQNMTVK